MIIIRFLLLRFHLLLFHLLFLFLRLLLNIAAALAVDREFVYIEWWTSSFFASSSPSLFLPLSLSPPPPPSASPSPSPSLPLSPSLSLSPPLPLDFYYIILHYIILYDTGEQPVWWVSEEGRVR